MSNGIKHGSGAYNIRYDLDEKTAEIDFSGIVPLFPGDNACYRNDSTVFLFVANSYKQAYLCLKESLEHYFESKDGKKVEHLILPFFFTFRHYLELVLKSFYMAITDSRMTKSHIIKDLFDIVLQESKKVDDRRYNYNDNFENWKKDLLRHLCELEELLNEFYLLEPRIDYFRYLYDSKVNLERPIVTLDYKNNCELFDSIINKISIIEQDYSYLIGYNYLLG